MLLAASTIPSFVHVTVVAGEPEDVQFRVKGELESEVMPRDVIDTGAEVMRVGEKVHN